MVANPQPETTPDTQPAVTVPPEPKKGLFSLSPLNQRRWNNFKRNRRALWSLCIFVILFGLSLFAEFIANDKPIMVRYRGETFTPIFNFYPETQFGGDFRTEAAYRDPEVRCLIITGGLDACFDDPDGLIENAEAGVLTDDNFHKGMILWPLIPYSYDTPVDRRGAAPLPPNEQNWLGTDKGKRDLLARVIYGFRLSILFTLIVTACASVIGIVAGALQGYFGGWLDLIFQRVIEIWGRHRRFISSSSSSRSWGEVSGCWSFLPSSLAGRRWWAWCGRNSCVRATWNTSAQPRPWESLTGPSCSATCCPTRWWRR
ncbi:hypothetical protein KU6B_41200 [Mameliella alba]|nr:hypothetical protein KU6B_41200 [Mameliella alba]